MRASRKSSVTIVLSQESPAAIPQPSMSSQSFGPNQAKLGVVAALPRGRSAYSCSGTTCSSQYAGRSRTSLK